MAARHTLLHPDFFLFLHGSRLQRRTVRLESYNVEPEHASCKTFRGKLPGKVDIVASKHKEFFNNFLHEEERTDIAEKMLKFSSEYYAFSNNILRD